MIRLFCGYDQREEPGLHVFVSSVLRHASAPVSITPLTSHGLSQGTNTFTLSRFLVPALCEFEGHAIFCDGTDMLALADIAELDALFDPRYAVQVVKHPAYVSSHRRKYVGTAMEVVQSNYMRKNWASCMVINCAHRAWHDIREQVLRRPPVDVLQFTFLDDSVIGELPPEWNVLVDEGQELDAMKLAHWTCGIPHFSHYANAKFSGLWFAARDAAWQERRV